MQPVSKVLLIFRRLRKCVVQGFAVVLLIPPHAASATATFYGRLYTHYSLFDIVQVSTLPDAVDGNRDPSGADRATGSTLHSASNITKIMVGASIVETSYISSVSANAETQSSPITVKLLGVPYGVATTAAVSVPQDLYVSLLDETVIITASNNIDSMSTDAGHKQSCDVLIDLATAPASGLARVAEAARRSSLIDSCPESSFDETRKQGPVEIKAPDISIERRVFEDAVRHRRRKFHKADTRLLIQSI